MMERGIKGSENSFMIVILPENCVKALVAKHWSEGKLKVSE